MRGNKRSIAAWTFAVLTVNPEVGLAGAGDLLVEYRSNLGTAPDQQGWLHQGRCLLVNCPNPSPPESNECYWQGCQDKDEDPGPDNDCTFGVGCHTATGHYNSPWYMTGPEGECTYTEWITFDDGDNSANRLIVPDSSMTHSPPWGAPAFVNAPLGYSVIRVSTGDGNLDTSSLFAPGASKRNRGKVQIHRDYTWTGTDNAVTGIVRLAAGPMKPGYGFFRLCTPHVTLKFFVNGNVSDPNFGRIGHSGAVGEENYLFGATTVAVALPGTVGPHWGEFFTLRVICRDDGTFTAYFNEQSFTQTTGSVGLQSSVPSIEFGALETDDECVWIDFVQLFDGAVPPPVCHDPVFDVNNDGHVNSDDLHDGLNIGAVNCATGPGAVASVFDALPEPCKCLDVNNDHAIDLQDFAVFQRCLTVGGGAADPSCDDFP